MLEILKKEINSFFASLIEYLVIAIFLIVNVLFLWLFKGEFTSVYNNRIKPFKLSDEKNKSATTNMIVIADGDVIKNDLGRKGPQ